MITYEKIKELCKIKKTTISNVEKECGFSKGSLSKIEKNQPGMDRVEKLATYFGVSVARLCGEKDLDIRDLFDVYQKKEEDEKCDENLLEIMHKYPELKDMLLAGGRIAESNPTYIEAATYAMNYIAQIGSLGENKKNEK